MAPVPDADTPEGPEDRARGEGKDVRMGEVQGLRMLLKQHPFFKGLDAETYELLDGCGANEVFNEGDMVFREGQPADKLYLIRVGEVDLQHGGPGGDITPIQTLRDGDVLGWSWLVPPYSWRFSAQAKKRTRLISLDANCLRNKCDENHDVGYAIAMRIATVVLDRLTALRLKMVKGERLGQ